MTLVEEIASLEGAPVRAPGTPGPARPGWWWGAALAAISGALVALGWALGWRGTDLAAQLYRVQQFQAHGFTLWDSQWYGGHWMLDYSVGYPAVAALVGIGPLAVASAVAATAAFTRLVVGHFGPRAWAASGVFAVGVVVETAIGQLAFFTGEALGLCCLWALVASRRRWVLAAVLALAATLSSPLAGGFLALLLLAWMVATVVEAGSLRGPRRSPAVWGLAAVGAASLVPVAASAVLFPGAGPMPYPVIDWVWEAAVAFIAWCLAPRRPAVVRAAISLYLLATLASELVPTEVGGNVGRLEDAVALPLVLAFGLADQGDLGGLAWLAWLVRRLPGRLATRVGTEPALIHRLALALVVVPVAASQWLPAQAALTTNAGQAWTSRAYYAPLVSWLRRADEAPGGVVPLARVEVVPTRDHWEAAYVAPAVPLARGWERQLDVADAPIFYGPARLTAATYRSWLEANGVRYVALAGAPLDPAGVAEAALVEAGVPGLRLVWRDADWRVYEVLGPGGRPGPGIVSGPARLAGMSGDHVEIEALRAGRSVVRVRWAAHWAVVAGSARLASAPGGWTSVVAARPGPIRLQVKLRP